MTGYASAGIAAASYGGQGGTGGGGSGDASGGEAGIGGDGGNVEVDLLPLLGFAPRAIIYTNGDYSYGVLGQSLGGVGADGGKDGGWGASGGGGGGGGGNGGAVSIFANPTTVINTTGTGSTGIVAQSIGGGGGAGGNSSGWSSVGGGGGLLQTFSFTDDNNGGGADVSGGSFGLNAFHFGGSGGSSGHAGDVTVTASAGAISTQGNDAYGILAQSIGGGGGVVLGGTPQGSSFFGSGTLSGDGGNIAIDIRNGASLTTSGQGAVGIFAQSIGGGGGLAGDTGLTAQRSAFAQSSDQNGSGQTVAVTVEAGSSVTTNGANAPALLLQSIGGGGGRVTNSIYGAFDGTAGAVAPGER
ncbi:MAG TPA: hypothetical protein VNX29_19990 [Kaistia sp.]|nr:hypothetical protein [Kaistia sp.]